MLESLLEVVDFFSDLSGTALLLEINSGTLTV